MQKENNIFIHIRTILNFNITPSNLDNFLNPNLQYHIDSYSIELIYIKIVFIGSHNVK